jgi:hypothetical protein
MSVMNAAGQNPERTTAAHLSAAYPAAEQASPEHAAAEHMTTEHMTTEHTTTEHMTTEHTTTEARTTEPTTTEPIAAEHVAEKQVFAERPIAVYGASGHTGRFVLQELQRRGLPAVAIARRPLDVAPTHAAVRLATLDDAAALDRALAGCAVVINCAGPFIDTARPLVEAALRAGGHYIDVTAEQPSAQSVLDEFDAPARAAGIVVTPAAGFYGGLADLLASALLADDPHPEPAAASRADASRPERRHQAVQDADLRIGVALSHWWPTTGTRVTGTRNQAPRVIIENGHRAPLPQPPQALTWTFAGPFGAQPMVELPFSEVVTLAHHLPLRSLHSFISERALQAIRDPATPAPTAVDAQGRSAQRFAMEVVADGPRPRRAWATGQDIYAVSAPMVVEAAARMRLPAFDRRGALVLGQLFEARAFLDALAPEHLAFGTDQDL